MTDRHLTPADFGSLYRRYAPDVERFALGLSGDRGLSEEIASETFVRVWTAPAPVRLETVKAYLFTIARNFFLEEMARRRRHTPLHDSIPDPAEGPEENARRRDELRAVLAGLQKLPEIDRAALLMRAEEGMPYEEIAAALGLSLAAAKVRVHRARLKLATLREPRETKP